MPREPEIVDLPYDNIITGTLKAYLLDFDGEQKWVPVSIGEIDRDERIITVPTWWAEKEELR